ncbi:MAG: hypothetical protein IJC72_02690 [Clostridia bacterium]|nr:hypothetical protein [Clostridia bacterium]
MKKLSLTVISLALALTMAFSLAGCSQKTQLSFNQNVLGGQSSTGLLETLTYSVNLVDNYNDLVLKSSVITDEIVKYEFTDGKMTVKLSALDFLPDGITTDIDWTDSKIYHLETDFSINVDYTIGAKQTTHKDTIYSSCYFLSQGHSFAPIYSDYKVNNAYLRLPTSDEETAQVEIHEYQYITSYNQNKYTMVTNVLGEQPNSDTKEFEYTYKTLIDNTQLLFALRSFTVQEKTTHNLPVVSPSYGIEKTLAVTLKDSSTFRNNKGIAFGDAVANDIPVNNVRYIINATENTGSYHFIKIQKSATKELPFKAFMVEYAAPLLAFGTFNCMGALVYTLESVTLGN